MKRRSPLLGLFLIADVAISVLSMGFYSPSWNMDFDLIFKYLVFVDGYNYFTNPVDFVLLAILRLALIVTAVALITFHYDAVACAMFMPMLGVATFCYSYTLVKFLAFSEDVRMIYYPGVWFSVIWSILAALLFALVWYFVLTAHHFDYQRLVSERFDTASSAQTATDVETAVERTTSSDGEMVSRLTSDCQTMSTTVSTNLNVFLRNGVMLIGALVFMFVMSWRLSLKLSEKTQTTIADANQIAEEVLSTMRTVRSFACERRESDRFEGKLNETLKMNRKKAIAYMGYTWNNEFCDNAILVAVLFYGGHLVMSAYLFVFSRCARERTVLIVAHRLSTIEKADRIAVIHKGLLVQSGNHAELMEVKDGLYYSLVSKQILASKIKGSTD
ncbi:ABC transporter transmembrane region [Ancylostoma duodenale]|uniref:ABC transporter transmembrane region n=1 Tax=Ancylostoma duodenale TaxID=51022 RepID=A0A0C2CAY5_9BILA|nr:ABC transporter transmembrane region [Ancylostoma duodenale]